MDKAIKEGRLPEGTWVDTEGQLRSLGDGGKRRRGDNVIVIGEDGKPSGVIEVERRPKGRYNKDRERQYDEADIPNATIDVSKCGENVTTGDINRAIGSVIDDISSSYGEDELTTGPGSDSGGSANQ